MAALKSEYNRSFPWSDSYKSPSWEPSHEQKSPFAGNEATNSTYFSLEPPIQRKRRVPHLSESVQFDPPPTPSEDDFLICGANADKFSPSKPYRNQLKHLRKDRMLKTMLEEGPEPEQIPTPDTPRLNMDKRYGTHSPPTSQPPPLRRSRDQKMQSADLHLNLDRRDAKPAVQEHLGSSERDVENRGRRVQDLEREWSRPQNNVPRRKERSMDRREEIIGEKTRELERQLDIARMQARQQEEETAKAREKLYIDQKNVKTKERLDAERKARDLKEKTKYIESRQRQLRQDAEHSRDEARRLAAAAEIDKENSKVLFDYAKKHQIGMESRNGPPTKMTEYSREFEKKKDLKQPVPLLQAEDIVYRSHLDPPKRLKMPTETEYGRQFKPFKYAPEKTRLRSKSSEDEGLRLAYRSVDKRAKSAAAPRRSRTPPPRRSRTPPPQRSRSPPPARFSDDDERAHQFRSAPKQARRSRTPPPRVEVGDRSYSFDETLNPNRMSFPLGPQKTYNSEYAERFQDFRNTASSMMVDRALSKAEAALQNSENGVWLKEVAELRKKAQEYKNRAYGTHFSREHLAQIFGRGASDWDRSTVTERSSDHGSARRVRPAPRFPGSVEATDGYLSDDETTSRSPQSSGTVTPRNEFGQPTDLVPKRIPLNTHGRVPTPRVKHMTRHHLDRTTPAHGGTLLSSPPELVSDYSNDLVIQGSQSNNSPKVTALLEESRDLLKRTQEARRRAERGLNITGMVEPELAAGKPTEDPYLLLDESASQDRPLDIPHAHYRKQAWEGKRRNLSQGRNVGGQMFRDEDAMSTSMRSTSSVASTTSSLASEVLERARRRKDEFWGRRDD